MSRERYHKVWQRGYEVGLDTAHSALREALAQGVTLSVGDGFDTTMITVRSPDRSQIAMVGNIGALREVLRRFEALERNRAEAPR